MRGIGLLWLSGIAGSAQMAGRMDSRTPLTVFVSS